MYIVMEGSKLTVTETKTNTISVSIADETAEVKVYIPNDQIDISMGGFKKQISRLELMECLQESFESGVFYIDAIEDFIFSMEHDMDQLLIENAQLRRELSHGRSVLLNKY